MGKTSIEWTDYSWNPIRARNRETGKLGWWCSKISPGCKLCYAEKINLRVGNGVPYAEDQAGKMELFLDEKKLAEPLRWKKPRRVFVESMSDLFHEAIEINFIGRIFIRMQECPQHTFQILTKRPKRCSELLSDPDFHLGYQLLRWPLPNLWLGVSVENQKTADERIGLLQQTPAAVRFVSEEPSLGQINRLPFLQSGLIHWWIWGGESGPNARPPHPDLARQARDQCVAAGVPFFFKQWGEWLPEDHMPQDHRRLFQEHQETGHNVRLVEYAHGPAVPFPSVPVFRVGKRAAGRLLDGREWNELPESAARERK